MPDQRRYSFDPRSLLRALAAWGICATALLFCGAALFSSRISSLSLLGAASSIISFLCAVGAGTAAVLRQREHKLLTGLLTALFLSILLLLTGFLAGGRPERDAVISVLGFTISGCLVGALLPQQARKRGKVRFGKMHR